MKLAVFHVQIPVRRDDENVVEMWLTMTIATPMSVGKFCNSRMYASDPPTQTMGKFLVDVADSFLAVMP